MNRKRTRRTFLVVVAVLVAAVPFYFLVVSPLALQGVFRSISTTFGISSADDLETVIGTPEADETDVTGGATAVSPDPNAPDVTGGATPTSGSVKEDDERDGEESDESHDDEDRAPTPTTTPIAQATPTSVPTDPAATPVA